MDVLRPEMQYLVAFPDGSPLGELNKQLEETLNDLSNHFLELEVAAPIRPIRETIGKATREKEAIVRVNINLYGSRSKAQIIGQVLSKHKVYLQRPDYLRPGVIYDNPHVLKLANVMAPQSGIIVQVGTSAKHPQDSGEELKKNIAAVFSSLRRGKALNELEGDQRLTTALLP